MDAPILELRGLSAGWGRAPAVKELDLAVAQGEIVTIIGANGAGKSTTLMAISGILKPMAGQVLYQGRDASTVPPEELPAMGLCQVPEGRRIFPRLTVAENLDMGAFRRRDHDAVRRDMDRVFELFPRLKERERQQGGTLSGGEQQMLAIGRALMGRPRLLLLDEPSLGLAPLIVEHIFSIIRRVNETEGMTVLLVEQNANLALKLAHRGYVMETGRIVLSGTGRELLDNPDIRRAYLGE
ncbi:High-affinity branched-chain amino acid transport ATP-binding protein LivF [Fundidesulfovibrio magnetotacticus]|uniref:High-affinity branched-chain amino acid transport ATP-binding protein LivF n=1 Tax=Fundidesulfovibrio magnetotacticus TaxID=2730080 RepID=A0A6V8LIT0_9BACT|nr:ABC transporter ATP-binding protein [Fundidesulfovibrio magnetotacticus]GFK92652.1 High-affinity branched-chain amino acid transport ATP-binding protein LivF [Fundidesulfovibrio magnetotacticus]